MEESSRARAGKDTDNFRSKRLWFLGVEVLGSGAIAGLASWMLWDKSTLKGWQVGLITFLVFTIGLLVIYTLIYLWNLFRAPYHQRNEARELLLVKPKPIPLQKRYMLLRTIAEGRMATIEVAENIENLKLKKTGNVIFCDEGMWDKLDRIQRRFNQACESLESETFAAGTVLEPILKPLFAYMRGAAELDSSTVSNYKFELEKMVMITRNRIEELSQ